MDGHVRFLEDDTVSAGEMCGNPNSLCKVCQTLMEQKYAEWKDSDGGGVGLRRRAELTNAYAMESRPYRTSVDTISAADIEQVYRQQKGFDPVCHNPLSDGRWEVDHKTPISRGGGTLVGIFGFFVVLASKTRAIGPYTNG